MEKEQMKNELYDLGLRFNLYDETGFILKIHPFIVDTHYNDPSYHRPGFYFQVLQNLKESISFQSRFGHTKYPDSFFCITLKVLKTSKGFVIERKKKEEIMEEVGESFYNWIYDSIEERLNLCKLRLLFLNPYMESFIK